MVLTKHTSVCLLLCKGLPVPIGSNFGWSLGAGFELPTIRSSDNPLCFLSDSRTHPHQNVVGPSLPGSLQSRLPQLHHMVESRGRPMFGTPLVCVGPGTNSAERFDEIHNFWFYKFTIHSPANGQKMRGQSFDSLGLLHGSPLHVVVDVLSSFQPLSQHGRGVVHVVVRRCPETEAE